MTNTIPVVKPISKIHLAPGSLVTIYDVTWEEFESILQELGNKRAARVAYNQGTLEIMVPLPEHEIPRDLISDIVKTLLRAKKIKYQPFGSTTFKREGLSGVEPDACFYIKNCQMMIGRRRLQADDPPPDLAIETDVTSKTTLDAYEAIGVPELWIYDGGNFTIYLLQDNKYIKSNISPNFPEINISQIITTTVERSWVVGNLQALEELEGSLEKLI
ncbi:MAG: Uma2 family endonuclease [Scytonematopsis contorta HA4267-MV1]|jgi:Uma2 family endonuclease|nr:Uma2 family endonuclease [Scytonematopsis contorta HA4267-MV1]